MPHSTVQPQAAILASSSSPPGRTLAASLKEAPIPLNAVAPLLPATISRPGPVVELEDGVFRTPSTGKYYQSTAIPSPECSSTFSGPSSSLPRAHDASFEPPSTVEPFQPVTGCSPSQVRRTGKRIFRTPYVGKATDNSAVGPKRDVAIYYQNAGGMNSCIEDYYLAVSDTSYDIIVLIETWLDSRTLSTQVFGPDYEVFRCDRNTNNSRKSSGGGTLVAVHTELKAKAIENDLWNCLEQVWVSVELGDRTLFLCSLYIAPDRVRDKDLIDAHCQSLFAILETASPIDDVVILGDFNLTGISWKPSHNGFLYPDPQRSQLHAGSTGLLDSYSAATLSQINHVVNENGRTLDLCFVSNQDKAPFISPAPCALVKDVPHHPPLVIAVEDRHLLHFVDPPVAVSHDFRKADHGSIAEVLASIDWDDVLNPLDVEAAAQTFSHVLTYVIDRHVPKITQHQAPRSPWQTKELRKMKSAKRAALRKFTKHRSLPLRNHYVRLNHEYQRANRQCFSQYQRGIEAKFKSQPKRFWKYVNEQRKESGLPTSMELNGVTASTTLEICQLFAEKFAAVFSDERLSDDQVSLAVSNVPLTGQTLAAIEVESDMVGKAASVLKSSYNPGPDGVPSVLIKKQISNLLFPLQRLFQMSLSSGIFPSSWKIAHMFPVHKKGSKRDVGNYRGITALSATSKLFELVVMEPLLSHCMPYLSSDQHGFTDGRSTTTNLLCLTSYITNSLTERTQTDVVYTDLSAAFDKLNHAIAIAKLDRFGISGNLLSWFRSYLTGRQLMVAIGDCRSVSFHAASGIPQGSHLGPLIFLLYFNDVHLVVRGPRLSYADDLKLFLKIRSMEDCLYLQQQVDLFANWCALNRMVVNPAKCSIITFTRRKQPFIFDYSLLGTTIERVDHVKDLGVILDKQLTYKQHISYIVDKASRTLGLVFRIAKNFTDIYCLKSLYCSLVRSTLEYCSAVWSPSYNNGVERIESVQRRFMRYALRRLPWSDPFRLPSYESRCQLINLDLLSTRRDASRALTIADTLQGRIDCGAILEQIDLNVRPRSLRNNSMLRMPLRRTNYSLYGAISGLQRVFNRVASIFDFHIAREALRRRFLSFFAGRN